MRVCLVWRISCTRAKRLYLANITLLLSRHWKPHQTFQMRKQHRRSFIGVVSKTGTHKSVCGHNTGTGGYKTIKGIWRQNGMLPTHYNDKRHLDAGTSVHGAGHLPLQAATVFLQTQQPHRHPGTETAGIPVSCGLSSAQPGVTWTLQGVQGTRVLCATAGNGSIFLQDAGKMQWKSIPSFH